MCGVTSKKIRAPLLSGQLNEGITNYNSVGMCHFPHVSSILHEEKRWLLQSSISFVWKLPVYKRLRLAPFLR